MSTHTLYAIEPRSQRVRLVVQVTPEGWADESTIEATLGGLISVLNRASIQVALVVGARSTFVVRRRDKVAGFDVDELATSEALAPLPVSDDPSALLEVVSAWIDRVATDWQRFVPSTSLPKRVPEIVPLIVGSEIRVRDGEIGIPRPPLPIDDDSKRFN